MNLFVFQRTAVTEQGNVIPNAEITVYPAGTTGDVDLFDDAAGTPKGNPFNAGPTDGEADGFIQFYVTFGQYDIAVNGTVLWENQTIGRPELYDITSLSSLNTAALVDGQQFNLKEWRPGTNYGGGTLEWDASLAKSNHNGGTIFSPTVPAPASYSESGIDDYCEAVGETDPSGDGCFVRRRDGIQINELMFGAVDDYLSDMTAPIQKAIDVAGQDGIEFWGDHTVSRQIVFDTRGRYQFKHGGRGSLSSGSRGLRSTYAGADAAFTFDGNGGFDQGAEVKNGIFTRANDTGPLILLKDVRDTSWFNCAFYDGSDNIHFDAGSRGCWYNNFVGCKFVGRNTSNTNNGVRFQAIEGPTKPNENWFLGCSFRNHGTHVNVIDGGSNKFVECAFEQGYFDAIVIRDENTFFSVCRFEQNAIDQNSVIFRNNADQTRIIGATFASSTALPGSQYLTGTNRVHTLLGVTGLPSSLNRMSGETLIFNSSGDTSFRLDDDNLTLSEGVFVRISENNIPAMQQRNSSGNYQTVIKLNQRDRSEFGNGITSFLPEFADDSAAGTGGLANGDFYRTAAGDVKVKLP